MMSTTIFVSLLAVAGSALGSPMEKRALTCGGVGDYAPIGDVQSCIDFLNGRGTQDCGVGSGTGGFCVSGNAVILGSGSTSTPCQNVAAAAQAILGSCTTADQYVGGTSTIGGNDNVLVTVRAA
ncbi:hypothetical protein BDW59DRAFT_111691 [Aspergillus cavernicola]|uniref:Uncharacterized protein n=1 Tax=Aspergillus cavernicola TaxID=176166 RepID=A0ABR4I0M0_9EURO